MNIVEEATRPPGMCLASRDTEGPFIDTGLYARHHDPYIYLSVRWVMEQAEELGMVPKEKVQELQEQFEAQTARIKELERFVEAHQVFEAAVEGLKDKEPEAAYVGMSE